jgi:hypothetical protein
MNENISHWVETDKCWKCFKCKGWGLPSFAFCPHCGRKMKGDETNE